MDVESLHVPVQEWVRKRKKHKSKEMTVATSGASGAPWSFKHEDSAYHAHHKRVKNSILEFLKSIPPRVSFSLSLTMTNCCCVTYSMHTSDIFLNMTYSTHTSFIFGALREALRTLSLVVLSLVADVVGDPNLCEVPVVELENSLTPS